MRIDELGNAVMRELNLFEQETNEKVQEITKDVARSGLKMIKKIGTYNDRTGKYRKGFRLKNVSTYRYPRYILSNRLFRLTHLLEHGHSTSGGTGRASAHSHWKPTEQYMMEELEERLGRELGS